MIGKIGKPLVHQIPAKWRSNQKGNYHQLAVRSVAIAYKQKCLSLDQKY